MTLYLARHCDAVHPIEDPARPLSADGREQARRLAAFLPRALRGHESIDEVLHSGVLRARQTAAILAEAVHPTRGTRQAVGLTPGDNARAAVDALRYEGRSLLVVTHLPLVADIARLLLGQPRGHDPVVYRTGTIAALAGSGDHWSLEWVIHPALLPPAPRG
jgi:phosphohistidine phosphatase